MPRQSKPQKKTVERVMHEYKHGELRRGPKGRGGKVRNRRQAIAIALSEAGASKYATKQENKRNLRRTKRKERSGQTALAEKEARRSLAERRRRPSARRRSPRKDQRGRTRAELYAEARRRNIPGRSQMNKAELARALARR